ncbi:MAG: 5-formyltetrahydrofolate cyclo-ligase [Tunicatimonas sp.]
MEKSQLRETYRNRRAALSEDDYRQGNQQLVGQLFAAYSFVGTVHCFLSAERQREVDTGPIIRRLWAMPAVRMLAPRCRPSGNELSHHALTPGTRLEDNRWGIPEPVGAQEHPTSIVDWVLVPLLAFDRRGHRVGYGKGFYDRFLAACRPEARKIGLSLFSPVANIDDVDSQDVAMDAVVTPNQVWRFK